MTEQAFFIKTEIDDKNHGRFILEPLTQGYGQTLGNSLRRVLLTSLQGASITSVKIENVKHQFSILAGLKEDILEFLLNVKKIRIISASDTPVKMTLSKKGPGEIKAADIEVTAGIEIINKDLTLGILADKKASLEAEFTVQKGYGYITAEEQHLNEIGVIPLDAFYSPVTRVNYMVEATRVGRMTNLDKLIIDIWTDGTILPSDAMKAAAKILVSYFMQVYEPRVQHPDVPVVVSPVISDEILKMRIEELDIPTRIVNAFSNGGIETIGQLLGTQKSELMKIKNLGVKSLAIVEEKLKEKGVTLAV